MPSTETTPSSASAKEGKDNASLKKRAKPWGVMELMVGLIGGSVMVSAIISFTQPIPGPVGNNSAGKTLHSGSALHASLKNFKKNGSNKLREQQHEEDEQEPHGREGAMDAHEGAVEAHDNPHTTSAALGGLSCSSHGGPMEKEATDEMVYWQDIPSDTNYVGPFFHTQGHKDSDPRYLTFEPDGGGWNNIRMAMETVIGLGIATGRTIVLPPDQRMYLLAKNRGKEKTDFSFADFFPLHQVAEEHPALNFISTETFLTNEAMTGHMKNSVTGEVTFPPGNRTNWDGQDVRPLKLWFQNSTMAPHWSPGSCMAAFPASGDHKDVEKLHSILKDVHREGVNKKEVWDNPTPVNASTHDRLRENLSKRGHLCVYNEEMQRERVVHFMCSHKLRVRMLVHFYAFLFFEDWRDDLWMKRFMRDHLRYTDEIQCAAARIVQKLRRTARELNSTNTAGEFDTLHVRRGDFQFKQTRIEASEILENVQDQIAPGGLVFIATDERNKKFFDALKEHYTVHFLDDYKKELEGVNTNYYGMIDQLVASRGRSFFGCWHSTFSGFIHRIRGYYADKHKLPGYEKGLLPTSYYYATVRNKFAMHSYAPLYGAFFNREFPTSWRDIDKSVGDLPHTV